MTDRYSNGKIYKLVSDKTDKIYIGSCCVPLYKRLYRHKITYKYFLEGKQGCCSSRELFEIDDGNVQICLIENYPCKSKDELERRERFHIENMNCVNRHIPTRSQREYREDNKETIAQKHKAYREDNKEKMSINKLIYYETNREVLIEKEKQRYKLKREELLKKVECPYCKLEIGKTSLSRHIKRKHSTVE